MKSPLRLTLLLTAIIPAVLFAAPQNSHRQDEPSHGNAPSAVPDTSSTLLLLGAGLGGLMIWSKKFVFKTQ